MISIRHRTTYRYQTQVSLRPHQLLLRPREGPTLRLQSMELTLSPAAVLFWSQDVAGNAMATATFDALSDELVVESTARVELSTPAWPVFDLTASVISYPFRYSADEMVDLGALVVPQYPDPEGRLARWAQAFVNNLPTDTLSLLKDLNAGILNSISYQERSDEGTQLPLQTLDRGWGACRDIAVLFIEAARTLGFGARIVSGYAYDASPGEPVSPVGGTTHAWAEIYLSGAGWIAFDPTNCTMGGANLIPVAVGRNIRQIMPVVGEFIGMSDAFAGMSVEVLVRRSTDGPA